MKKYAGGIAALVVALGLSSFSTRHETKRGQDLYPYYFSFDGNSVGEESDSTNYTWLPDGPTVECDPGTLHCVINADKNASGFPILRSGGMNVFTEVSSKEQQ
ncbi:MAG TPA: hypothetical protein VHD35_14545 [Chitinophagaceae bacterium]|nr:hypothetical protein [Chitinophagaceae bacterium]